MVMPKTRSVDLGCLTHREDGVGVFFAAGFAAGLRVDERVAALPPEERGRTRRGPKRGHDEREPTAPLSRLPGTGSRVMMAPMPEADSRLVRQRTAATSLKGTAAWCAD